MNTNPKPKVPATTEAERLQKLVDICKEGEAVGKIIKDFYDKNPKALILKELVKQGGQQ